MNTIICNVEGYESEDSWMVQSFSVPDVLCLIYFIISHVLGSNV